MRRSHAWPLHSWRAAASLLYSAAMTGPLSVPHPLFRLDGALPAALRGAAACLGNFDGVHMGHQALAQAAAHWARLHGRPVLAVTFDPHPARLFKPELPPFSLSDLDMRAAWLAGHGVDATVILPFDRTFADLSPEAFVHDILHKQMGISHVVTGGDFSFGKARAGTVEQLAELGQPLGMTSQVVSPVEHPAGFTVSSTRIRDALSRGDMAEARELLTRPWQLRGVVSKGDQRGRTIGFPTANVELGDYQRPLYGVYAVRAQLPHGRVLGGVANVGLRPTFNPPKELLEVHLFDFAGDIYGQLLTVEFLQFLRPEQRFDGLDALKAQIASDSQAARLICAAQPTG